MRINPVDYVRIDSPSLISDVKVLCQNLIPPSVNRTSDYFEGRAREFLEGIILTLVRMHGVLTLGQLYSAVNLIPGGGDKWLDFAFEMSEAGFEVSARIEEEIANAQQDSSSTGYQGILGELFKALACLSDPMLLRAVSPPFDFSMEQLCDSGRPIQLYIMPPAEFIAPWAPVIKALFVAGMIYKARKPSAPRQTWILDECAQLGGFPLVTQLFTYGAGIGIRPWAIFQSIYQMDQLGPKAGNIITSSAQVRSYFAIRDIETASVVSRMLGVQTLEYDDELVQARARHAKHQAVQSLMSGGDPFMAGLSVAHHRREAEHRTKQQRLLRTPDEVLRTPKDKQLIFMDDLPYPLYADRRAYFEQDFMAGRYHPNPYHPPVERVRVKTRKGHEWLRVLREPVPPQYADYPQYRDGMWSRIIK
jgi:type IV secretion system protein VirD4